MKGQVSILKFVKPTKNAKAPPPTQAPAPAQAPAPRDDKADKRRQTRRNQHLAQQLSSVEGKLEGLRSLVFYTLFEYDVPEGAEPGVDAATAEILGALDAAAAGVDLLRRGLISHRDPNRTGTPPRGTVPAVEGSTIVTEEELEAP